MTDSPYLILVVDDEPNIRSSLERILSRKEYEVVTADSGEAALQAISRQEFALALIDLNLPGLAGIEILKTLRQQSPDTIAIILTAHGTLATAIEALREGTHDYLLKPCPPAKLLQSVREGLQKRDQQRELLDKLDNLSSGLDDVLTTLAGQAGRPTPEPADRPDPPQIKRFLYPGNICIDFLQHTISIDGHPLALTPTEFDLVVYLVRQGNKVVSSQELVRAVHGYDSEPWEPNVTIRSHIYHIRRKIKEATGRSDIIRTVRGVGYTISH